jgi:hypothetical protein
MVEVVVSQGFGVSVLGVRIACHLFVRFDLEAL